MTMHFLVCLFPRTLTAPLLASMKITSPTAEVSPLIAPTKKNKKKQKKKTIANTNLMQSSLSECCHRLMGQAAAASSPSPFAVQRQQTR